MKKLISIFMAMTILMGVFIIPVSGADDKLAGNSSGNIVNGYGKAVTSDGWIYYVLQEKNSKDYNTDSIYKIKIDGTQKKRIYYSDEAFNYIGDLNIIGDKLYFLEQTIYMTNKAINETTFNVINTDGSNYNTLINGMKEVMNFTVYDNTVYYIVNEKEKKELMKMDLKTKKKTKMDNVVAKFDKKWKTSNMFSYGGISVVDDCLYYSILMTGFFSWGSNTEKAAKKIAGYYKLDLKTNKRTKLEGIIGSGDYLFRDTMTTVVSDGYIYFGQEQNKGWGDYSLYRMTTDGKNKTEILTDIKMKCFNVSNGWIYYCAGDTVSKQSIVKIDVNGKNKKTLVKNIDVSNINVVGDWIYYTQKVNGEKILKKIKTDGTKSATVK